MEESSFKVFDGFERNGFDSLGLGKGIFEKRVAVKSEKIVEHIFDKVSHRPWPLPSGPSMMEQRWHDLLFAHWRVEKEWLRPHVPSKLEIDTYQGEAWLGVVPFRMEGVRLRYAPAIPGASCFPELNVRTYVKHGEKAGVWFFSLDAASRLAVTVGRKWFQLPYFFAGMSCEERGGWIAYASERKDRGAPAAVLRGKYHGEGETFHAASGTLEHFLTERYCLYSADAEGNLKRVEIHHLPWNLQLAKAEISENSMTKGLGLAFGVPELLHFSRRQDVGVWPLRRV
ncbi:MAG TPA: DUF2071 domain-containing protein [Candidatus Acidoferrum sp.]|nr:DUF2071 domain-containing protein [Candidatus Acidoferrum sp.]